MPVRLFVLAAAVLAGCSAVGGAPTADRQAWDEAYARWDAQRPDRYAFTLGLSCECVGPGRFYVSVNGAEVDSVAAFDPDTGGVYPAGSVVDGVPVERFYVSVTIDELFRLLDDGIRAGNAVRAEYDDALGYPTHAQPDVEAAAVDGSVGYSVRDVRAL